MNIKAASIPKLQKYQIKTKKAFNTTSEDMDSENSELTNSDDNEEESSHFQFD